MPREPEQCSVGGNGLHRYLKSKVGSPLPLKPESHVPASQENNPDTENRHNALPKTQKSALESYGFSKVRRVISTHKPLEPSKHTETSGEVQTTIKKSHVKGDPQCISQPKELIQSEPVAQESTTCIQTMSLVLSESKKIEKQEPMDDNKDKVASDESPASYSRTFASGDCPVKQPSSPIADQAKATLYQVTPMAMLRPRSSFVFNEAQTSSLLPRSMVLLEKFFNGIEECASINFSRGLTTIFCRAVRPVELMTGLSINHFFLQSMLYFLSDIVSAEPWIVIHEGRRVLSWVIKGLGSVSPAELVDRRITLRNRLLEALYKSYSKTSQEAIEYSCIIQSRSWPHSYDPNVVYPTVESLPRCSLAGYKDINGIPGNLDTLKNQEKNVQEKKEIQTPSPSGKKTSLLERVG